MIEAGGRRNVPELEAIGVDGHDAFFCPTWQPDERGSAIVDFRAAAPSEAATREAAREAARSQPILSGGARGRE